MSTKWINELLDPALISAKWDEGYANKLPWFSETVFSKTRTQNLELSFLKGSRGTSAISRLSAFDANYTFVERGGLSKESAQLPFLREAMALNEKDRRELGSLFAQASPIIADVVRRVYEDQFTLIERAKNFIEFLCFQVLQNAEMTIATQVDASVSSYNVTYDPSGQWLTDHIINIVTPWENVLSNPLIDIVKAVKYARKENGTVINKILLSDRLEEALLASEKVAQTIFPQFSQTIVGIPEVERYLATKLRGGIQLVSMSNYRDTYFDETSQTVKSFLDQNRAVLLPAGDVGKKVFSITPEEDAKREDPALKVAVVEGGIAISQNITIKAPYISETVVSAVVAPSFEGQDSVFGLEVAV